MIKELKEQTPEGYAALKEDVSCLLEKVKSHPHKAIGNIIIQTFLESGRSFSFAGRQREIVIDGQAQAVDT